MDTEQPSTRALLWHVAWSSPQDTHSCGRALDVNGDTIGERDGPGYPAVDRRQGDHVVGEVDITFPLDKSLEFWTARVGQYRYPVVANLAVVDAAGNPATDFVVMQLGERR